MPRLLRFGAELIFYECEQLNVEVIIINHDVNATPEQELVQDVLEVITVFSAQSLKAALRSMLPKGNVPPGQNLRSCASFARLYGRLMPSE